MTRPAGKHITPVTIPPAERLPKVRAGKKCTCWGGPGLPDQPCTSETCDPDCRACAAAEEPFFTRSDLRFLETGSGPTADALRRLWASADAPKLSTTPREDPIVCDRGHPKTPGRDCRECINLGRRARYARTRGRQGATG
jgi:hypothetical protein